SIVLALAGRQKDKDQKNRHQDGNERALGDRKLNRNEQDCRQATQQTVESENDNHQAEQTAHAPGSAITQIHDAPGWPVRRQYTPHQRAWYHDHENKGGEGPIDPPYLLTGIDSVEQGHMCENDRKKQRHYR